MENLKTKNQGFCLGYEGRSELSFITLEVDFCLGLKNLGFSNLGKNRQKPRFLPRFFLLRAAVRGSI